MTWSVEDGQVEPTEALGVGYHVDLYDLAARDGEPMTETGRPSTVRTTPAAPFTRVGLHLTFAVAAGFGLVAAILVFAFVRPGRAAAAPVPDQERSLAGVGQTS